VIGAGDDDPVRIYSLEEQGQLTEHLHAITRQVHAGDLRDRPLNLDLLRALHDALFRGVRDHAGRIRGAGFGSEYLTFGPNRSVRRDDVERSLNAVFVDVALEQEYTAALNYYFRTRDLDPLVDLFVRLYVVGR
jgi:hypothetical protein